MRFLCSISGCSGWNYRQSKQESEYNLTLANIEALASGENGNYYCALSGDVDCYGMKVKIKVDNLSLDWE